MSGLKKRLDDITVTVTLSGDTLREEIIARASAHVHERLQEALTDAVALKAAELVDAVAKKDVIAAVKAVLVEGWNKTDEYGAYVKKVSLKDRIGEMLRAHDRYGSNRSWLEELVKKETETYIKGDLKKEIDAATAKLRAEVDQVTRAKLNEALRAALGVAS